MVVVVVYGWDGGVEVGKGRGEVMGGKGGEGVMGCGEGRDGMGCEVWEGWGVV